MRNVSKTFNGVTVLRSAQLDVISGEIHGLVGQNGSGKSTLIKILSGFHQPDPLSEIHISGALVDRPIDPATVGELGLAFIHQDLALVPKLTVLENMRIGRFQTNRLWGISWRREREQLAEDLSGVGIDLDPDLPVSALPAVERALLAIARGLANIRLATRDGRRSGLLVLDEPTAYLPADGVDRLFDVLRQLSSDGIGSLLVSHRLDEILRITDRVTVLRDGDVIDTLHTRSTSEAEMIEAILGQSLSNLYPDITVTSGEPVFEIKNLAGNRMRHLDLEMTRGEIVGITGLAGMGYEEIPYLITGAQPAISGQVVLSEAGQNSKEFDLRSFSPLEAIRNGIYLLPADRSGASGVGTIGVDKNVTLPILSKFASRGVIDRNAELEMVGHEIDRFSVVPPDPLRKLGELSGGNQQKVLLAKWLSGGAPYGVLHEPTQGVDVGAKKDILRHIADAASRGTCFIIVSVEYEDLSHICDRVLVVRGGLVVADLRGPEISDAKVASAVYGSGADKCAE